MTRTVPQEVQAYPTVPAKFEVLCVAALLLITGGLSADHAIAQTTLEPTVQVIVTRAQDGPVQADAGLTLREAIEIVNGTLPLSALSEAERSQVTASEAPAIYFDLPANQTTIELQVPLPPLTQSGLTIDGTTQPGYEVSHPEEEYWVAPPIVAITPETGTEILRGFSLMADNIVIRGLSLYGFTAQHRATAPLPPADIFIAQPSFASAHPGETADLASRNNPPRGIVIEYNWLGLTPENQKPEQLSAFGISVFNGEDVTIRHNRIAYHEGSGIISGNHAEDLEIVSNEIIHNGFAGMPDGIRLEGHIGGSFISQNRIANNAGSGIFLFKPEGAVEIRNNTLAANGQRYQRAAIYLMGNNHQVIDNQIESQQGPGVVVTAYSQGPVGQSWGNVIVNNTFGQLQGLSIDLNTRRYSEVQAFQMGDGPNPQRDSDRRRQDTGNGAVNTPRFLSREFFILENQVVLEGEADPNAQIQLYFSRGEQGEYGPLSEPLGVVWADPEGRFSYVATGLREGDRVSAIATHATYGTSEPALNIIIRRLGNTRSD